MHDIFLKRDPFIDHRLAFNFLGKSPSQSPWGWVSIDLEHPHLTREGVWCDRMAMTSLDWIPKSLIQSIGSSLRLLYVTPQSPPHPTSLLISPSCYQPQRNTWGFVPFLSANHPHPPSPYFKLAHSSFIFTSSALSLVGLRKSNQECRKKNWNEKWLQSLFPPQKWSSKLVLIRNVKTFQSTWAGFFHSSLLSLWGRRRREKKIERYYRRFFSQRCHRVSEAQLEKNKMSTTTRGFEDVGKKGAGDGKKGSI